MRGYNDDLVMSFSMGLWIRETEIKLRGYRITEKSINNINSHKGVYTTEIIKTILGNGKLVNNKNH